MNRLFDELRAIGGRVLTHEPLSSHTGFRTGGPAKLMFFPADFGALRSAVRLLKSLGVRWTVIGNGSNLLAPDEGYDGVIICTADLNKVEFMAPDIILCEAGAQLKDLCSCALEHSLSGAEFAYGIPGTVGGAVFMNAGAYGGEISDIFVSAEVLTAEKLETFTLADVGFSYRNSVFQRNSDLIILNASFKLMPGAPGDILNLMHKNLNSRREKQPLNYPSCGSPFKRPKGGYASALIDQCGLKGCSVGGAMVSEKHAGFIINYDSATSRDILELMELVSKTVREKTGFVLTPEVRIME